MLVQITGSYDDFTWYKNKILKTYEVIECNDDSGIYLLSPKQLRKMKKADHLTIGILKADCIVLDENADLSKYDIENFLKEIDD